MFDTVSTETRGTAAGFMNTFGWLAGGGSAPLVIGWISQSQGLGTAIAMASSVYLLAGVLLLLAARQVGRRAPYFEPSRSNASAA